MFTAHFKDELIITIKTPTATVTKCLSVCTQPTKSATFCGNLPKTYSMICLAYNDDDKNSKSRKVAKKSSFLSWGLKNKMKSASTLSLPTADHSSSRS